MRAHETPRPRRALLLTLLVAIVWFAHLNVSYRLVYTACEGGSRWPVLLAGVISAAVVAAALAMAWRERSDFGDAGSKLGDGPGTGRQRFLTGLAVAASGFFLLIIVVTTLPALVLDPCR